MLMETKQPHPDSSADFRLTTTTELLEALGRGSGASVWLGFLERYTPVLRGVAGKLGLGPEDAEDVAQQTLMEFVRDFGRGRFDRNRARLRTWILSILRHRVADIRRLRARDAAVAGVRTAAEGPSDEQMDGLWQREVDRRQIEEALELLRTRWRTSAASLRAFELTALRDVPAKAAALECGLSVNAVYLAKFRFTQRLKEIVAELAPAYSEDLR